MDVAGLVDQLREAGVPEDDYEVPGRSMPRPREGALFVAQDGDRWLVGAHDRGRLVVASAWPDEDTSCTELYGRLTAPLPDPMPLADERAALRLTSRFVAEVEAREPRTLTVPAGVLVDRFGALHGRWLFPATTPFPERSLPPDLLDPTRPQLGRSVFEVQNGLEVLAGAVAPWFGQPGGGIRFDLVGAADVWTLVRDGVLAPVQLSD